MTVHLNADRGRVLDPAFVLNLPDVALVSADDELVRNLPAPSLRRILSRVDKARRQHTSCPYENKKKLGNKKIYSPAVCSRWRETRAEARWDTAT